MRKYVKSQIKAENIDARCEVVLAIVGGWVGGWQAILTIVAGGGLHGGVLHEVVLVLQAGVHDAPG